MQFLIASTGYVRICHKIHRCIFHNKAGFVKLGHIRTYNDENYQCQECNSINKTYMNTYNIIVIYYVAND